MTTSRRLAMLVGFAAMAMADNPWLPKALASMPSLRPRYPHPKLHSRHITVAAMKRHARKRRNIRARSSKRRA